jgi:N-acylneuraminate cytidylyltransferase
MNIGIIPLRKGSKGIIGKNKRNLLGRPLFSWVLYEAVKSKLDKVFVYTDDEDIIHYIENEYKDIEKVEALNRSKDSASDVATTEYAIEEFLREFGYNFNTLTLIQATSPLLTYKIINESLVKLKNGYDSSLTVTTIKRFFWSSIGEPLNYDYMNRPRRQDFNSQYVENGACYSITKEMYLKCSNRIGGRIALVEMTEDTFVEIDEEYDFLIVESLLKKRLRNKGNISEIEILCLDVDGVLTSGKSNYTNDGESTKGFSLFDGKGLELLQLKGVKIVVITSEDSDIVRARMKKLGIDNCYYGVKDKYRVLDSFLCENDISWNRVAYIGDDVNDLTNIIASGVSLCPKNANEYIKLNSMINLSNFGGSGAVREACELILKFKD